MLRRSAQLRAFGASSAAARGRDHRLLIGGLKNPSHFGLHARILRLLNDF